jgi:hypothetical protein
MGKKSGSGSGMNNPDHISWSLKKIFGLKILRFFYVDPGQKNMGSGILDGKKNLIRDPGKTSRICNTGKSYSPSSGDIACRILPTKSMCWKKGQGSKSCCSSAETSSCICRTPNQCPGTGEALPVESKYPPPN